MIDRDFCFREKVDAVHQQGRLLFRYYKVRYAAMYVDTKQFADVTTP